MRQVTGSNSTVSNKMVSIQLLLGGHSFSADILSDDIVGSHDDVCLVVNTHKVTLVPCEEFEAEMAAECLAIVGLGCAEDERAVYSDAEADKIAVMAVAEEALTQIEAKLGSRARFTTPLLESAHDSEPHNISLRIADGVCYMRYADNRLRMAEAVRVSSPEDTLYYTMRACELLGGGGQATVYLNGDRQTASLLKRYFKRVVCES